MALEYAEAITFSDLQVEDALMARLKAHFDDDAIVDLTALIAFQNMSSKFNAALLVSPQGFCRVMQARPNAVTRTKVKAPRGASSRPAQRPPEWGDGRWKCNSVPWRKRACHKGCKRR